LTFFLSQLISSPGTVQPPLMQMCQYLDSVLSLCLTLIHSVTSKRNGTKSFPVWMEKNHPEVYTKFLSGLNGYSAYLWSLNAGEFFSLYN
jgi:hypothetical protein